MATLDSNLLHKLSGRKISSSAQLGSNLMVKYMESNSTKTFDVTPFAFQPSLSYWKIAQSSYFSLIPHAWLQNIVQDLYWPHKLANLLKQVWAMVLTKFLACQKFVVLPAIFTVVCFGMNIGADKIFISQGGFEVRVRAGDPRNFSETMHTNWGILFCCACILWWVFRIRCDNRDGVGGVGFFQIFQFSCMHLKMISLCVCLGDEYLVFEITIQVCVSGRPACSLVYPKHYLPWMPFKS